MIACSRCRGIKGVVNKCGDLLGVFTDTLIFVILRHGTVDLSSECFDGKFAFERVFVLVLHTLAVRAVAIGALFFENDRPWMLSSVGARREQSEQKEWKPEFGG